MDSRIAQTLKIHLQGYDAGDGVILVHGRQTEESLHLIAREILKAMRTPTDRMRYAAENVAGSDAWEAMIDAALSVRI